LKPQIGSHPWKTENGEVNINTARKSVRENIKVSAKESLHYYELKNISHGSMKDSYNYSTKENKPNCSDYRMQEK
jgi:hypothetical protein